MAPKGPTTKQCAFDPRKFLATIGEGRKVLILSQKRPIFAQGDAANTILYIQKGKVKLTIVSQVGREATLGK
jgi:CRP/FNR family cyclic AMP-dependent transcriptional regulator